MVRPGYMIYGYYPADVLQERVTLTPALQLAARIIQIKTVPLVLLVSYGRTFETTRESVIATAAIGYADGISRLLSIRVRWWLMVKGTDCGQNLYGFNYA